MSIKSSLFIKLQHSVGHTRLSYLTVFTEKGSERVVAKQKVAKRGAGILSPAKNHETNTAWRRTSDIQRNLLLTAFGQAITFRQDTTLEWGVADYNLARKSSQSLQSSLR